MKTAIKSIDGLACSNREGAEGRAGSDYLSGRTNYGKEGDQKM